MTPVATPIGLERPLPTHLDLPCEDKSVPKDFFERMQAELLGGAIESWLKRQSPGFECIVGADNYIYWKTTTPPTLGAKAPDFYLVQGKAILLDGRLRRSYVLWQEKTPPTAAFEFISEEPGGEWDATPQTGKFWVYEQGIRIPHYAIWDRFKDVLDPYILVHGRYRAAQSNERGHYAVPELGLEYGLWEGTWKSVTRLWLRWWDAEGRLLLAPAEIAEQEQQRADQADRQKRILADKLRELGIDPDKLT